jgi:hypothetical protein
MFNNFVSGDYTVILPQSPIRGPVQQSLANSTGVVLVHLLASEGD